MQKIKKQIEYNVCPWCEEELGIFRDHCRKTHGHAMFQAKIAWQNLYNEIITSLKQLFHL